MWNNRETFHGLSIIWAYAATLLFFNNVLQSGVLFIIPLVLLLLLYGIGMDYKALSTLRLAVWW